MVGVRVLAPFGLDVEIDAAGAALSMENGMVLDAISLCQSSLWRLKLHRVIPRSALGATVRERDIILSVTIVRQGKKSDGV